MASIQFANNASSLLAASIGAADLAIQVADGSAFPSPGAGQYFLAALVTSSGAIEIVRIESRAANVLTVATGGRGQEGTTAAAWTLTVTRVELRLTRGTMENLLQKSGDTMSGDLDMDGNDIVDARMTGDTTIVAGQLVGTAVRGTEDDSSNEILVPSDGTRATAGGQRIMTQDDDVLEFFPTGTIVMWFGSVPSIPTGWSLCDGSSGTPDLRDRFVVGAGSSYALSATGGAASQAAGVSGAGGDHSHGGSVGATTLTTAQMPAHSHRIYSADSSSADVAPLSDSDVGVAGDEEQAGSGYIQDTGAVSDIIEETGGGGSHTHTVTASGTHTHTVPSVATLPPYRALYYIMKT